jgi:hypothetical protein
MDILFINAEIQGAQFWFMTLGQSLGGTAQCFFVDQIQCAHQR